MHRAAADLEAFCLGTQRTHSLQSGSLKNTIASDRVHLAVQLIGVWEFETKQRFAFDEEEFVLMVAEGKSMTSAYL